MAVALAQLGRYEEAFIYLDEAIKFDPNYSNPYNLKGMIYFLMKDKLQASVYLKKAISLGDLSAKSFLESDEFLN